MLYHDLHRRSWNDTDIQDVASGQDEGRFESPLYRQPRRPRVPSDNDRTVVTVGRKSRTDGVYKSRRHRLTYDAPDSGDAFHE